RCDSCLTLPPSTLGVERPRWPFATASHTVSLTPFTRCREVELWVSGFEKSVDAGKCKFGCLEVWWANTNLGVWIFRVLGNVELWVSGCGLGSFPSRRPSALRCDSRLTPSPSPLGVERPELAVCHVPLHGPDHA